MYATESDSIWKSLLVEFLGTFTLVFVGGSAVAFAVANGTDAGVGLLLAAAAFGLALMTLIYIWGSYSGAHFNPAVSFGFAVAGQMNWGLMLGYWIAQLLGGLAAGALIIYFFGNAGASVGTLTNTDLWKAILLEAFLTFFLVIAYLFVYRNPMIAIVNGIVIGAVLAFATLVGGSLTGGSTNPARSLGSAVFSNNIGTIWIYIIGPLLGALVAALVYKLFTANFDCCYKLDDCGKRVQDDCGNNILICERPKLDKCGKACVDDCNKVITEKVEVIERCHNYKQETYKKEAMEWFKKQGVNIHHIDKGTCDTGCGTPIVSAPVEVTAVSITPVMSAPVMSAPVMSTPVIEVQPVMSAPMEQAPVMQTLPRRTVTSSPYSVPRY
jgi:MIP family channel proteins